jgi:hypothetical protein
MDSKSTEYRIARQPDLEDLKEEVERLMKEGFQPLGGVAVEQAIDQSGYAKGDYLQAMAR